MLWHVLIASFVVWCSASAIAVAAFVIWQERSQRERLDEQIAEDEEVLAPLFRNTPLMSVPRRRPILRTRSTKTLR